MNRVPQNSAGHNFLFVGVGGQGILTASDIAAEVGLAAGYDAKKSEIHGFSQRGGVVESHVRWGARVGSPMGEKGAIDFLVSFEILETTRFIEWLKPDGRIVTNTQKLIPMSVSSGGFSYPTDDEIKTTLESRTGEILYVNALDKAQALGNVRLTNTIVLGALSTHLDLAQEIWLDVIQRRVPPRFADLNRLAFEEGQQAAN